MVETWYLNQKQNSYKLHPGVESTAANFWVYECFLLFSVYEWTEKNVIP